MSDVISFAELGEQHVELLPARTVLSMLHGAINGPFGGPPGDNGHGTSKMNFLGMFGWGGSDSNYSQASGDSGSSAQGSHGWHGWHVAARPER
jgi:hypothetical protein